MTESTAVSTVQPATQVVVPKEDGNIACTAFLPAEMDQSQTALIEWAKAKVDLVKQEFHELNEAYEHARKQKWKTATLKRHANLACERFSFYDKMLSALEHGFVIVPNFPVSLFAIRTEAEPKGGQKTDRQWNVSVFRQNAELLPHGSGDYQNPLPIVASWKEPDPAKPGSKIISAWPDAWDKLEFPVSMSKPQIMEATSRAMALKIFDQFGILPNADRPKGDPLIVGQLIDPRDKYRNRLITFMVAWHLDTRTL